MNMHSLKQENPEIHGDPHNLLRTDTFMSSQIFASVLKKTNILVTFVCTIICFEQFAPILLFGTILLLHLTDLPPYTVI